MIVDLAKFLVVWTIILVMFTCVSVLAFGELKEFHDIFIVFTFFFESTLGNWDLEIYDGVTDEGHDIESL